MHHDVYVLDRVRHKKINATRYYGQTFQEQQWNENNLSIVNEGGFRDESKIQTKKRDRIYACCLQFFSTLKQAKNRRKCKFEEMDCSKWKLNRCGI